MISLQRVPENHTYQPNNVCPGCFDVFEEKPGAEVLCHEGLKDKQVLQCFMDKNCAEEWVTIRIQSIGLSQDGSLDCYNCRTALDPTSILNQEEVDRLQNIYETSVPLYLRQRNLGDGAEEPELLIEAPVLNERGAPPRYHDPMSWTDRVGMGVAIAGMLASSLYVGSILGESRVTRISFAVGAFAVEVLPLYGAVVASEFKGALGSVVSLFGGAAVLGASLGAAADVPVLSGAGYGVSAPFVLGAVTGVGFTVGKIFDVASSWFSSFRGNAA